MGNTKVKGIVVELGGDVTSLNKAIKSVSAEARGTQSELKKIERLLKMDPGNVTLLKQKQELLNHSIEETEEVVTALKDAKDKADQDMANGTEINEKAYRELERQIEANEITLRNTRQEADKVASALNGIDDDELRDVADAAGDAEEALEDAAKEAADFGDVLKAGLIAEAAGSIVDSMKNVAEETKEYRKIMGSLEVSSDLAGYSAEQTGEAYKKLYGILADDQSSATTLANLQALGLSQDDLLSLIDNCIGGWAKYGDSIPIDGLAEAINGTVKAGQVAGTFADILNWGAREGETYGVKMREATEANEEWNKAVADAETAEDYFNLALQQCSTEAERVNLIMQAMADQGLASAAEQWEANNASLVEANQSSADLQEQMGMLGEKLEPLTTKLTEMISAVLEWFNSLDSGTQNFILGAVLLVAAIGPVAAAFSGVTSSVSGIIQILPKLQTMFSSVLGFIAANPIVLLIAAIVGFAAIFATKGDEIQAVLQKVDDFLQGVFATDWTTVFGPVLGGILNGFFANLKALWDSVLQILNGVIDFIRGVFTGDWERVWLGVKEIFGGVFSGLVALAKTPINFIIGMINSAIDAVNYLISGLNRIPGVNIGSIGQIPMLASGGTVWSGSAIVGEAGPELLTVDGGKAVVQPLSVNTNKIEGLLGDINGRLGSDEPPIPIKIQLTLDGNVIGETALKYSRMKGRAYGN